MTHKIQRINEYDDIRFPREVLIEHGAFLIDDKYKCSFKITSKNTATVEFDKEINIEEVIDEFRFYAEHITKFYDINNKIIKSFPSINIFKIDIEDIQPSQFYVDKNKVESVSSFITNSNDIIVPLAKINDELVSLDGHTRLHLATKRGYKQVYGFYTLAEDYIRDFVLEAKRRNILTPYDLKLLTHEEYEKKWYRFCNEFFKK